MVPLATGMKSYTCLKCYATEEPFRRQRGHYVVTVALGLLGVAALFGLLKASKHPGAETHAFGTGELLLVVLLCFAPNVAYQVWRRAGHVVRCGKCGCADIVPADSPRANQIRDSVKKG